MTPTRPGRAGAGRPRGSIPNAMPARLLQRLQAAERKLSQEIYLRLQNDGSGTITTFEDLDLFRFESLDQLNAWLRKPAIVQYNDEREAIGNAAS